MRGSRRAGLAARLALVLASVVMALALAELAARLVPPASSTLGDDGTDPNDSLWSDPEWRSPPPRTFRPDPVLAFDNAPSQTADVPIGEHRGGRYRFKTNAYGLRRNDEIEVARPQDTFRVLVLGDSQTGGFVDNAETYSQLLEDRWQSRAQQTVEALNAGVIGYAPQQEFLWYQQRGRALQPNVVVLALYIGNDVRDLIDGEVDAAVIDEQAGRVGPLRAPGAWLGLHSRLAQMGYNAARTVNPLRGVLDALGMRTPPPALPFTTDALVRVLRECHGCWLQTLKQAVRVRDDPARGEQAYRRLEEMLRLLNAQVAADGGRLALLVIPSKPQVEPEDERGGLARAARLLELDPETVRYEEIARERILGAGRAAGVAVVDPLPGLQQAARGGRVYYRRDWHLNVRGNQALAEILDAELAELGLAPPGLATP